MLNTSRVVIRSVCVTRRGARGPSPRTGAAEGGCQVDRRAVHNGLMRQTLLLVCAMGVVAIGLAQAAPDFTSPDLAAAAPRLVPAGSRVIVAEEMNATYGMVAYRTRTGAGALAVRWRAQRGQWVREQSPSVRFADLDPRRGQVVRRGTVLVSLRVISSTLIVRAGLWLDGKPVAPLDARMTSLAKINRGRHTVAVFSATKNGAAAVGWSFRRR